MNTIGLVVICLIIGWVSGCWFEKSRHKVDGDITITHNDGDIELSGMTISTDIPVLVGQKELTLKINIEGL